MDILFAFFPLFVRYNHGVALLSELCQARALGVGLCVLEDIGAFVAQVRDLRPRVVGFSCVTVHDYRKCLPYMRAAKAPGRIPIVFQYEKPGVAA
jgi:hypothetical protein